MAEHFRGTGHILRLIEFMDVGTTNGWRLDDVVGAQEMIDRISGRWPLEPLDALYPGEVAKRYRYADGEGEIGVIASVTQPFCGGCTRARLSAEGRLYTCLFGALGHDLRSAVRDGGERRRAGREGRRDLDAPRRPLLRAAQRQHGRQAQGGDVPHRRIALATGIPPD